MVDPDAPNNAHAFLINMVGTGQRVLEVGCSAGHVTEQLVSRGNRVVGVEVDVEAAESARQVADRVWVHDLDSSPLSAVETETFDVIALGDVLEHFRDPAATLRDLVTMLEPDGRLVISVPHVGFIDVRLMLLQGRWVYEEVGLLDRTHLRWFTRESLRELLADAGFTAARVERVSFHTGFAGLPIDTVAAGPDVIRFIEADPEAHTFQFVVEAVRSQPGLRRRVGAEPRAALARPVRRAGAGRRRPSGLDGRTRRVA